MPPLHDQGGLVRGRDQEQKHWNSQWTCTDVWIMVNADHSLPFIRSQSRLSSVLVLYTRVVFEASPNSRNSENSFEHAVILASSWLLISSYVSFVQNLKFPTYWLLSWTRMVFEAWPNYKSIAIPCEKSMILESSWMLIFSYVSFVHNLKIPTYWKSLKSIKIK